MLSGRDARMDVAAVKPITDVLADFVYDTSYEDLPENAAAIAGDLILDSLGVTLAGTRSSVGVHLIKLARETMPGACATVFGAGLRSSVDGAAFVNGALAHALDMDDTAAGTGAHPSSTLLPALFAVSEMKRVSGQEFVTAYILGLEVFYRVALASDGHMNGWHRTSLFGVIATAAATSKLLGLRPAQISFAIGIATSFASGVQMSFGSMAKAIQVGNASRGGVMASLLAKEGCTGGHDALASAMGFGETFFSGVFKSELITTKLGRPYSLLFPGIGLKQYPCCGLTHTAIDLVLRLLRSGSFDAGDVESVTVVTETLTQHILVYQCPKTAYEARYSLEFGVAAALIDGEITAATFTDESVNRNSIQRFFSRVITKTKPDSEWEVMRLHSWNHPAEVTVLLKTGVSLYAQAPCAKGYPDLPLSREVICRKFDHCVEPILGQESARLLKERLKRPEELKDVLEIVRLAT